MKRTIVTLLVMAALALIGCGEDDKITLVKNGRLDFDKSTTIGNVFDTYKYFTDKKWTSFQDEQKRDIVQFEAEISKEGMIEGAKDAYIGVIQYPATRYVIKCIALDECPLNSQKMYATIQFIILPENKFHVSYVGTRLSNGQAQQLSPEFTFQALYSGKIFGGGQLGYMAYEWINSNKIDVFK